MRLFSRTSAMVVVAALVAFATSGCGDDETTTGLTCGAGTHASGGKCIPNIIDGGADTSSLTCGAGTHEDNGACVADDTDAGTGMTCGAGTHEDNGACVADEAGTTEVRGPVGAACEAAADCESGLICADTALDPRLVDGYCTKILCSDTSPCPPGSTCVATGGLTACFAHCDPGTEVCRDTLICQPLSTDPQAGICAPGCAADVDCPAGGVCDTATSICTPPPTCDPTSPDCPTDFSCFPTSVSPTGGYCFLGCDDPATCKEGEVCQPFGPGAPDGVCVPSPCTDNVECPAGATCALQDPPGLNYCKPPDVCPSGTCTETGTECVSGLCLTSCAAGATGDSECEAIHPGLACADSFGVCMPACGPNGECSAGDSCFETDLVCLPTGAFPGSPCAPADTTHNDPWCAPVGTIDQTCYGSGADAFCVPECSADAECEGISPLLTCVESQGLCVQKCEAGTLDCDPGYACETNNMACLPAGIFPGSPCGDGVSCATNFDGAGHNLKCMGGSCLIDCATGGDPLCSALGTALGTALTCEQKSLSACVPPCASDLTCSMAGLSCFDPYGEKACLPTGAFPGSPCRTTVGDECDRDLGGADQFDMECISDTCLLTCNQDTDCSSFNSSLSCYEDKGACFPKCTTNVECGYPTTGMACLVSEGVCLPAGSFPGGPCNANSTCDNIGTLTQSCVNDTCLVDCNDSAPQTGDGLCHAVNATLTCMPTNTTTGAGYCVPNGSFPGGPCNASDACSNYGPLPMACISDMCLVSCSDAQGGDTAVCPGVNAALTCDDIFTHACVVACQGGACQTGMSCATGNACLPTGSFPGSPCRTTDPKCDSDLGGNPDHDMVCAGTACVVDCSWDPTVCTDFGLTCQDAGPGFACL